MPTYISPPGNWPKCGSAYDVEGPIQLGTTQRASISGGDPATGIDNLYAITFGGSKTTRYVDNPPTPITSKDRLIVDPAVDPALKPAVLVTPTANSLGGIDYTVTL